MPLLLRPWQEPFCQTWVHPRGAQPQPSNLFRQAAGCCAPYHHTYHNRQVRRVRPSRLCACTLPQPGRIPSSARTQSPNGRVASFPGTHQGWRGHPKRRRGSGALGQKEPPLAEPPLAAPPRRTHTPQQVHIRRELPPPLADTYNTRPDCRASHYNVLALLGGHTAASTPPNSILPWARQLRIEIFQCCVRGWLLVASSTTWRTPGLEAVATLRQRRG